MSRRIWSAMWLAPALIGATALSAAAQPETIAQAQADTQAAPASLNEAATLKQLASYTGSGDQLDQVTSVSQLTDVRPTDWAFQALQSLVERYGCIVGYPDRTYRGNQYLTRYEFAAGLNACLDKVQELIRSNTGGFATKEDLEAIKRLQEEFAAELATLRGRVDALEARTATLEKQQFSTTTKLNGEVIFAIADTFGDAVGTRNDPTETIFADRVRLNFDTSFTGKDRLRTRLEAKNITQFNSAVTGTNMTRLGFDDSNDNELAIDELYYRFKLGDNIGIQIDATGNEFYDGLVDPVSPLASSGGGAISRFGRFNPYLRSGASGAGFTFSVGLGEVFAVQGGYIADTGSNNPGFRNGLFEGSFSALGQVVFSPSKTLKLAVGYVRSYYPGASPGAIGDDVNITGTTGSLLARRPFGNVATTSDTLFANVNFGIGKGLVIGGWYGIALVDEVRGLRRDATVQNGAVYVAFPDLGSKGSLGAILVGIPPKVTRSDAARDPDTSLHVEAFYKFALTKNIAITPGVIVIFDPEHNDANDTQVVGTIRTTFTF